MVSSHVYLDAEVIAIKKKMPAGLARKLFRNLLQWGGTQIETP
jgi:hypothetical protein